MEDWALRGMQRWPNVPALFGWLGLDRRGRWTIQGELISRSQIIDTINANYAADEQGRWYFQNGPQRGYVTLEVAPLVVHTAPDNGPLHTHTGQVVEMVSAVWLDEEGSILLGTEHGPALLADADLDWALARLSADDGPVDETALNTALQLKNGAPTALSLAVGDARVPLKRLDRAQAPARLGFVRDPQPGTEEAPRGALQRH